MLVDTFVADKRMEDKCTVAVEFVQAADMNIAAVDKHTDIAVDNLASVCIFLVFVSFYIFHLLTSTMDMLYRSMDTNVLCKAALNTKDSHRNTKDMSCMDKRNRMRMLGSPTTILEATEILHRRMG